jgi:hypothetical protein
MKVPNYIIEELASRRAVLFLGAGGSIASSAQARNPVYESPPGWKNLLNNFADKLSINQSKRLAKKLIKEGQYLDAAEILVEGIGDADFKSFLEDAFLRPKYGSNELVEVIHEIDPKIVVTTNYDPIYETLCHEEIQAGLTKCKTYTSEDIVDCIKSPSRLLLYAHGSIKSPGDIILSASQYYSAKQKYPGFYHLLESLFLLHTIVFVGYSLSDPDIQMLLELNSLKVRGDRKHIMFCEKGRPQPILTAMKTKYNVDIIEYPKGKHELVSEYLRKIKSDIEAMRDQDAL